MADIDIWPVVHDERAALAADLTSASLGEEQWSGPSQCEGWSVRDVLAHMTATASMTPGKFFPKMIASGFSFDKVQDKGIAAERGASGAETLSRLSGGHRFREKATGAEGHCAGRDDHSRRRHPSFARPAANVPRRRPGGSGRLLQGFELDHRDEAPHRRLGPAGDRHRLVLRRRSRSVGADAPAAPRHGRTQGRAERAQRRRRGYLAAASLNPPPRRPGSVGCNLQLDPRSGTHQCWFPVHAVPARRPRF